jgi:hypothetical protein
MIATFACFLALADKPTVGQKWHYTLNWHFFAKDIDLTDQESFDVEVVKVSDASTVIKVSQKLVATVVDDMRIATDPKALPSSSQWALSPSGSIAFMPNARFALESRFYRILKGILPEPKGDPLRTEKWTIEYEDDGLGMPQSRLMAKFQGQTKDVSRFSLDYRERGGTNGIGKFIRSEKLPFPSLLEVRFTNTKMSGGTDVVNCDLTLKLKEDK